MDIISLNKIYQLVFIKEKLFEDSGRLECYRVALGNYILMFWKSVLNTFKILAVKKQSFRTRQRKPLITSYNNLYKPGHIDDNINITL
jgi:hypothetical protein